MTVWNYRRISTDIDLAVRAKFREYEYEHGAKPICPFCPSNPLEPYGNLKPLPPAWGAFAEWKSSDAESFSLTLWVCPLCGWWYLAAYREWNDIGNVTADETLGAGACVQRLSPRDLSDPVREVRSALVEDYEHRKSIMTPRQFEEVVAGVLADFGYVVRVCGCSGDGGIDVILDGPGEVIGVQVKRWRHSIRVAQIRELVGALVLRGITTGLFVTTSRFQRGCELAGTDARRHGYVVKLINGKEFLDALAFLERRELPRLDEVLRYVVPQQLEVLDWFHGR